MADSFEFGGEFVWQPPNSLVEKARLTEFMRLHGLNSFEELMQKSTSQIDWFTDAVFRYLQIEFYEPYRQVVDLSEGIAFPRWCVGGKMNIAHNCVDKRKDDPRTAIVWEGEEGETASLTYAQLYRQANQTANALRALGLCKGDVIALLMPMTPHIVIAMLAIAKIGGVILPLFSGYGAGAVVSRLQDAGAKALFTADGAFRRGKSINIKNVAEEAATQLPSLQHIIVLRRTGEEISMTPGRDHWWDELISPQPEEAETEVTAAEDPLLLLYTSGTTGKPKGALHTHCGFPVKAAQDMAFGTDVHPADLVYWMTDMGWMMGPWLVFGALLLGASLFLYDGAPDYPAPNRVWALAERHRINQMGISPTLIRSLLPHGNLHEQHDLSALQCFASTGEPWNPAPWLWLFEEVGKCRIPIINYSGGTEISGGILMGNPLLPMKPCAFSAPCPGMAADVLDENGQPLRNAVGELVIRAPWVGMTRGFWKDNQRYLDTYWSRWENIWVHGDFAAIDADGMWYILGRSDDTLKIAGKRLGPAEVESVLARHPAVLESAAIGAPHPVKGSELVLFVVLKPQHNRQAEIRTELRQMVTAEMGKALAPKEIHFVQDLPKTRNAKVMRRVIRSAYLGQPSGDLSALLNPEALQEIERQSGQKQG